MSNDSSLSRRRLLSLGGAASTAAVVAPLLGAKNAHAAAPLPQVPRRTLGKTGKQVPILLLGGGAGFDAKFDPKIAQALRHGLDYVDAARVYAGGTCETNASTTLKRLKALDKVWITSKSPAFDAKGFEENVNKSLKELGRKSIDLYFLHGIEDLSILDDKAMLATAERLKKEGKIKHFGFSCHDSTVAELLTKAAGIPLIDSIMFAYNFRKYGDKKLNKAIDTAHKANIGLIAMKTQGSEAGFADAWKKFEKKGKWTKHQAVLKAVWADPRITAAVSHMDNLEKLQQNIAAAVDKQSLSVVDRAALHQYALATRKDACDFCDHVCGAEVDAPVKVSTALRCVMYHDVYDDPDKAQRVFSAQPKEAQALANVDFSGANKACPNGVDVVAHMKRAQELFTRA